MSRRIPYLLLPLLPPMFLDLPLLDQSAGLQRLPIRPLGGLKPLETPRRFGKQQVDRIDRRTLIRLLSVTMFEYDSEERGGHTKDRREVEETECQRANQSWRSECKRVI